MMSYFIALPQYISDLAARCLMVSIWLITPCSTHLTQRGKPGDEANQVRCGFQSSLEVYN